MLLKYNISAVAKKQQYQIMLDFGSGSCIMVPVELIRK